MNIDQFIANMCEKYPKNFTPIDADDLRDWCERMEMGDLQLEALYNAIKENHKYKTFPSLPDIKTWWGGTAREERGKLGKSPLARVIDETKHWSVEKLLRVLNYIWEKDGCDRSAAERNILHEWGKVLYHYWSYRDLGYREEDILKKCEKTKRAIERGERVSDLVPEERRDQQIEEIGDTRQGRAVKFEDIGLPL